MAQIDKIQLVLELFGAGDLENARKIVEGYIKDFPTVEAESRPKGKWIKNEYDWYYHCSVCKENNLLHTDESNALSDYCPHCGADMRGEE